MNLYFLLLIGCLPALAQTPVRAALANVDSSVHAEVAATEKDSSTAPAAPPAPAPEPIRPVPAPEVAGAFEWSSALKQSFSLLAIQHAIRLHEPKTRAELCGAFFPEWANAVSGLHGWSDGDAAFTQYGGHPMQGAWSGWIEVQNDPRGRVEFFDDGREYWSSRLRAMAFSAAYEIQWHLGPISEATIGHVGKKNGTLGYSEFVTSPTGGFGLIVAEDALDLHLIRGLEEHSSLPMQRFWRVALNPNRSIANVLRLKHPWYRDGRDLRIPAKAETQQTNADRPAAALSR